MQCKHIFAVQFAMQRRKRGRPRKVPAPLPATPAQEKRQTYAQNWPAYNKAQTTEKSQFRFLLRDLCQGLEEPPQAMGRPRISLADSIFSAAYKVYSTVSGRRFMTDLNEAHAAGFISRVPCYNSIFGCLESESVTPILLALIEKTSLPLKSVETDFAVDSSGFTSSRFHRWFDHKYGSERQQHDWVKVHIACGVKTNIITAVEIADKESNDCPLFAPLVKATGKNFEISQISGDKAYSSYDNLDLVDSLGAVPFLIFKKNATGAHGGLWAKMFHYFQFRRDEFLAHYHKRSNVESTFSMIKAKFRDHVRSKTDTAMKNEVLCKLLCHNICCLISAIHELGIKAEF